VSFLQFVSYSELLDGYGLNLVLVSTSNIRLITGVLISPQPDQEGNKLQRQKILSFIYPIY